jgi:hypothetical protein
MYVHFLIRQENEMGEACGMYGGKDNCIQVFGRETWMKEITFKTWV